MIRLTVLIMGLLLTASSFASLPTGRYECSRNGHIVKVVKVSAAQLAGVEVPVLEFSYPQAEDLKVSGVGFIYRSEGNTTLSLTPNASVTFAPNGTVRSEDECRKTQ